MNFAIYLPWDHAQLELVQELSNRHRNFKILLVPGMKNKTQKCRTSSLVKILAIYIFKNHFEFHEICKKKNPEIKI